MNTSNYQYKQLFSRFGVESGFLPDLCLIASALVMLIVRLSAESVATVTPLALELTVVQFLVASMCWGIRQYTVDTTIKGEFEFATLPRQSLLFFGIAATLIVGTCLTYFLSAERGFSLFLLLILAGNIALFFMVALFVVETIPLSRILLLLLGMFATASAIAHHWSLTSKSQIFILTISTIAIGVLIMAILSKRIGSARAERNFLGFIARRPIFLMCGPLYLFGFWLDKWIFWFFVDSRTLEHSLLRPTSSNMSGALAVIFTIPALIVAFYSFRSEIARHYSNFSTYILGSGTIGDIEGTRKMVGRSIKVGCINTAITQMVFSGGLIFFAPALVEVLEESAFSATSLRAAAIGNVFFVVYAFLFRCLLYFEDIKAAFWSGVGFCLGSIVFSSGMMFFDIHYGGIGLAIASSVGIVTASIPLKRRVEELDYLFFTTYQ